MALNRARPPFSLPSRLRPALRIGPVLLLLLVLFVSGCGGGALAGSPDDAVRAPTSGRLVLVTSGPGLARVGEEGRKGTSVRVTGLDAGRHPLFGPKVKPWEPVLTFEGIPTGVVTLDLEELEAGAPTATRRYTSTVDLTQGPVTWTDPPYVLEADPVVRSFVFLGCNRLQKGDRHDTPSTANAAQLLQDFAEITDPARFSPRPEFVFFTGDLVLNLESGTKKLEEQLQAWKALFATTALPASGIPLVAMPGNHEMLEKDSNDDEIPNPPTGDVWSTEMASFIPGSNGPTTAAPNPDGVQRDESRLSFTFRSGPLFFIIVNTETWEGGLKAKDISRVPVAWVRDQVAAANADDTVEHIFVFGHKPVGKSTSDKLDDAIAPDQAVDFYQAMAAPAASGKPTRVRGYLCAHAHLWEQGVPPNAPQGSTLRQVIAGNAGSATAKSFQPPHSYFGYSVAGITQAGRVVVQSWGRPVPQPYHDQSPQPASTLREHFTLYSP